MTPFELALAYGHVEVAKLLVEAGSIHAIMNSSSEMEDEDQYKGLDVGGKKMDWALDHHQGGKQKTKNILALHRSVWFNEVNIAPLV